MGYNIGTRLIEDFLAKSGMGRCADFREVGEVVAKVCELSFELCQITDLWHVYIIRLASSHF